MIFLIKIFMMLIIGQSFADVDNLTDQNDPKAFARRQALFNNTPASPGVRLALLDMKNMNKKYGLGRVDTAVSEYEQRLSTMKASLKAQGIDASVSKTDFKGYYITCRPHPACLNKLSTALSEVKPPTFGDGVTLPTQSVQAQSYQEGYVRARIENEYGKDRVGQKELHTFIKQELDASIKESAPSGEIDRGKLSRNIDLYRSQGIDAVDKDYRRLVVALDTLLETPFMSSNNLDQQMTKALNDAGEPLAGKYHINSAISGDDLFMVIKEGDQIERVVGVDARGLGNLNMQTRLDEYLNNRSLDSMDDVLTLSQKAITTADQRMDDSFNSFVETFEKEMREHPARSIDDSLNAANNVYQDNKVNFSLMDTRVGAVQTCGRDKKCIMNQVTVIHNNLKKMENAGIDGHLGNSCMSSFYWLKKYGL